MAFFIFFEMFQDCDNQSFNFFSQFVHRLNDRRTLRVYFLFSCFLSYPLSYEQMNNGYTLCSSTLCLLAGSGDPSPSLM